MTGKEMAGKIARSILRQQMMKIAFVSVFDRLRIDGHQIRWEELVQEGIDQFEQEPLYLERISELETAFAEAKSGDELIRLLHNELLRGERE